MLMYYLDIYSFCENLGKVRINIIEKHNKKPLEWTLFD